jgi:release factor glutamine methyltransferase
MMADGETSVDVRQALTGAARVLTHAGAEDAGLDARRLLAAALNCPALDLISNPGRALSRETEDAYFAMVKRRARGEPLARILGVRDFYGRPFRLTPATLEPRPDSECLIDTALSIIRPRANADPGRPLRILDIGTGSGCLLLTLLAELPGSTGVGTDISQAALHAAAENASLLGLADRCRWVLGSCRAGVEGSFDLIISNPPYIRSDEIAGLDAEVRTWDPIAALDGGPDGLAIYRAILDDIYPSSSTCCVIFEVGHDQADAVRELVRMKFPMTNPEAVTITNDMAGRQRCVALSTHTSALDEKYLGF